MSKEITFKQQQFAKEYIKNSGNATRAVEKAYPNVKTDKARSVVGSRLLDNVRVVGYIKELLESNPNTKLESLLNSLNDDLNATKPVVLSPRNKIEFVPDNSTRLETKKLLLKLHGADKESPTIDNRSITLNLTSANIEELKRISENITELNNKLLSGGLKGSSSREDDV